jgi:hypothetical protein
MKRASDLMTPSAFAIEADATLEDAAKALHDITLASLEYTKSTGAIR